MHCQSFGATVDINWSTGSQSAAPLYLKRYRMSPSSASHSNQGWQHGCLCKFLFQNWIPKTWGRRECREACRPLLNNSQGKRALLSRFMFLDPSHRNENIYPFLGLWEQRERYPPTLTRTQCAHLFLEKTKRSFASNCGSCHACLSPGLGHPQSWYLA